MAAEQHPEFAGKTVTFSQNAFYNGLLYVYPAGLNTEFLTHARVRDQPEADAGLVKRRGEQVDALQASRLPVIDADVILFATEKARRHPGAQARADLQPAPRRRRAAARSTRTGS